MQINPGTSENFNQLFSGDGVLRNEDAIVEQGQVFTGTVLSGGGSGPITTSGQIRNPAGSGVIVLIDGYKFTSTSTGQIVFGTGNDTLAVAAGTWANNYVGESNGVAQLRNEGSGLVMTNLIERYEVDQYTPYTHNMKYPILLTEGYMLGFQGDSGDTRIYCTFYGREFTV